MSSEREIILLGPQRLQPMLASTLKDKRIGGPLALVTAGWEERESEDHELKAHVGMDVVNLSVHKRVEDIFQRDPELFEGMRARHDTLRKLQSFYRMRLAHALESARELLKHEEQELGLIEPEREAAIEMVRQLDAAHLERIAQVHAEFDAKWKIEGRTEVARHREDIRADLAGSSALLIAGGHVAILLNRMRLLNVLDLAPKLPILAWSAGAMVLGERVILFHDSPPQGPGDAEVFEVGFGLCKQVVALPHATKRLRLDDKTRVTLFAKRFGPATCVLLEARTRVSYLDGELRAETETAKLSIKGLVEELEAA